MNNYETVTRMLEAFLEKGTYIKRDGAEDDSIEYIMKSSIANATLKFLDENDPEGPFYLSITTSSGKTFENVQIGWCELDENFNLIANNGGPLEEIEAEWFNKGEPLQRGLTLYKR